MTSVPFRGGAPGAVNTRLRRVGLPGFRVVGGGASVLDVGGSVGGEVGALVVAGSVVAGIVIGGRTFGCVDGDGGGGAGIVVVGALVAGVEVDGGADVDVVVDELTTCWSVDTDLESSPQAAERERGDGEHGDVPAR